MAQWEDGDTFDYGKAEVHLRLIGSEEAKDVWDWSTESGERDANLWFYGLNPEDYKIS